MDTPTSITVWFPENLAVDYHEHTLLMVARKQLSLEINYHVGYEPLLIELKNTGVKLFYNSSSLRWYVSGRISFEELVKGFHCDALYRNRTMLKTQHDAEIEPESLWLKRDNELILVNEDEMITCDFNISEKLFYKII